MFHLCEVAVLVLTSLFLVQGQPGIVKQDAYAVLRNTSTGPIVCALDEPHTVRNDTRSRLQCSATCDQNYQCSSFNFKDVGCGFTCEHFKGYPFKFTVDPNCRHYAVCANVWIFEQCINGVWITWCRHRTDWSSSFKVYTRTYRNFRMQNLRRYSKPPARYFQIFQWWPL